MRPRSLSEKLPHSIRVRLRHNPLVFGNPVTAIHIVAQFGGDFPGGARGVLGHAMGHVAGATDRLDRERHGIQRDGREAARLGVAASGRGEGQEGRRRPRAQII
jgi:hypothetical protein